MDVIAGNRLRAADRARLSTIAELVGCSVEDFLNGSTSREWDDTAEMLRLWSEISTEDGRRAALNVTRAIVATQGMHPTR